MCKTLVMATERELIERYFAWGQERADVLLGIGDDAALLSFDTPAAVTCDTLVEGTHFHLGTDAALLGSKALAVNLSDLAAMGATPRHVLLALTLPSIDKQWLAAFAQGFRTMAERHLVVLAGGDLTHGSQLSITVTALGSSPARPLRQDNAQAGDEVWLSGSIGGAHLELIEQAPAVAGSLLHDPQPRVELGIELAGIAHAAVDLSDGLCVASLLLARGSDKALKLDGTAIPLALGYGSDRSLATLQQAACGGEDYELLFTADPAQRAAIEQLATKQVPLTRIGTVESGSSASISDSDGSCDLAEWENATFQHFFSPANDDTSLTAQAATLGVALVARNETLVTAESCSAGLLAATLANVPGASNWLEGGVVAYTAAAKQAQLGVSSELLEQHGIVSEEVALAMCNGALEVSAATVALGITGWAGPEAGDDQAPGTVCLAAKWASGQANISCTCIFSGARQAVRKQAVATAINMLLDKIAST